MKNRKHLLLLSLCLLGFGIPATARNAAPSIGQEPRPAKAPEKKSVPAKDSGSPLQSAKKKVERPIEATRPQKTDPATEKPRPLPAAGRKLEGEPGDKGAPVAGGRDPVPAGESPEPAAREVSKSMAQEVRSHSVRVARLEKLKALFRRQGSPEKVARVEALLVREGARYQKELGVYRGSLSADTYQQVLKSLRAQSKASAKEGAGAPTPVPTPEGVPATPAARPKPAPGAKKDDQ
jgi:hypothetical protein